MEPLVTFNPCAEWPLKGRLRGDLHTRIYWPRRSADDNVRVRVIDTILTIHDAVVGRTINPRLPRFVSFDRSFIYPLITATSRVGDSFGFNRIRFSSIPQLSPPSSLRKQIDGITVINIYRDDEMFNFERSPRTCHEEEAKDPSNPPVSHLKLREREKRWILKRSISSVGAFSKRKQTGPIGGGRWGGNVLAPALRRSGRQHGVSLGSF